MNLGEGVVKGSNTQPNVVRLAEIGNDFDSRRLCFNQGLADTVAFGMANRDITNMASNLYGQDQNRMMQALGMGGDIAGAGLSPYMQLSQILGGPTVLSDSMAQSTNSSTGRNKTGSGFSIGL